VRAFPFPEKRASREELNRDLLYRKIPKEQCPAIADRAWETGAGAAREIHELYPGCSVEEIARLEGLRVRRVEKDNVAGQVRYFSEYYSGRKEIILYTPSIRLWARNNGLTPEEAQELILSHEVFHHLECARLGLTSEQYKVPAFRIGRWSFGKSSIRALSEIGAHAFSRTLYELRGKLPAQEKEKNTAGRVLVNHAVNDMEFGARKKAERIFSDNPVMRMLGGKQRGDTK